MIALFLYSDDQLHSFSLTATDYSSRLWSLQHSNDTTAFNDFQHRKKTQNSDCVVGTVVLKSICFRVGCTIEG